MSTLDSFRLDGLVAIVTGASRGLGAAMAMALAETGADVAMVARGDLGEITATIERLGRRGLAVNADLEDRASPDTILDAVEAGLGRATILINNAGIIRRAPFLEYSDDDWDAVMEVDLRAVFALSRAFARALANGKAGGRIINVASMLSFQGGMRVAAYTAAKSGLLGLTRAMANELAPLGINVNAIAPGYMETANTRALRDNPVRNGEIVARIPAGRWGMPEDLKGAVVFLSSPAAAYVHGATLAVDGGWLCR
jgi:2-deoxy-D-gluconate 3-dehydrogenase